MFTQRIYVPWGLLGWFLAVVLQPVVVASKQQDADPVPKPAPAPEGPEALTVTAEILERDSHMELVIRWAGLRQPALLLVDRDSSSGMVQKPGDHLMGDVAVCRIDGTGSKTLQFKNIISSRSSERRILFELYVTRSLSVVVRVPYQPHDADRPRGKHLGRFVEQFDLDVPAFGDDCVLITTDRRAADNPFFHDMQKRAFAVPPDGSISVALELDDAKPKARAETTKSTER